MKCKTFDKHRISGLFHEGHLKPSSAEALGSTRIRIKYIAPGSPTRSYNLAEQRLATSFQNRNMTNLVQAPYTNWRNIRRWQCVAAGRRHCGWSLPTKTEELLKKQMIHIPWPYFQFWILQGAGGSVFTSFFNDKGWPTTSCGEEGRSCRMPKTLMILNSSWEANVVHP